MKKEFLYVVATQIFIIVGNILLTKILINDLVKDDYGLLIYYNSIIALFQTVLFGSLVAGVGRFLQIYNAGNERESFYRFLLKVVFVFTSISIITISFVSLFYGFKIIYFVLSVHFIFAGSISILISVLNSSRRRFEAGLVSIFDLYVKIILINVLSSIWALSLEIIYFSYLLPAISIFIFFIFHKNKNWFQILYAKKFESENFVKFTWPFFIWGSFSWLQNYSDKIILNSKFSLSELADYGFLFQLGYTLVLNFSSAIMSFINPIVFGHLNSGNNIMYVKKVVKKLMVFWFFFAVLGSLILSFLGKNLIMLVFDYELTYLNLLLIFFISGVLSAMYSALNIILNVLFVSKERLIPMVLTSFFGVLVIWYFSGFGFIGIGYAVLIIHVVRLLVLWFQVKFYEKKYE